MQFVAVESGMQGRNLTMLNGGVNNILEASFSGIDPHYDGVQIRIDMGGGIAVVKDCEPMGTGEWACYIKAFNFTKVGDFRYSLTGLAVDGGSSYIGSGVCRIHPSAANTNATDTGAGELNTFNGILSQTTGGFGGGGAASVDGKTYLRGADGKYYELSVKIDTDGKPYMELSDNGITM